jgi:hypothetical protein
MNISTIVVVPYAFKINRSLQNKTNVNFTTNGTIFQRGCSVKRLSLNSGHRVFFLLKKSKVWTHKASVKPIKYLKPKLEIFSISLISSVLKNVHSWYLKCRHYTFNKQKLITRSPSTSLQLIWKRFRSPD